MSEDMTVAAEVRSVLIPTGIGPVLLPNTAVTDVIGFIQPESLDDAPPWFLGNIVWRRQNLPLVSLERAFDIDQAEPGHRARIAVCTTLNGNPHIPNIGLVARSIPRLVRVTEDNIQSREETGLSQSFVSRYVNVSGQDAIVPDLDEIERQISEFIA